MEINYQLELDDLTHARNFASVRGARRGAWLAAALPRLMTVLCILATFWITFQAAHGRNGRNAQAQIAGVLVSAAAFPVVYVLLKRRRMNAVPKRMFHLRISETGLHSGGDTSEGITHWSMIEKVADDEFEIYFVDVTGDIDFLVPKRAFDQPGEADRFVATARQYHADGRATPHDGRLPGAGTLSVTFVLSESDVVDMHWQVLRASAVRTVIVATLLIGVASIILYNLVSAGRLTTHQQPSIPLIAMQILGLVVVLQYAWVWFSPSANIAAFRKRGSLSAPTTVSITSERLGLVGPEGSAQLGWDLIGEVVRTGQSIHVFGKVAIGHLFMIPIAAFESESHVDALLAAMKTIRDGGTVDLRSTGEAWPPSPASRE